jgi:hypothetical protein
MHTSNQSWKLKWWVVGGAGLLLVGVTLWPLAFSNAAAPGLRATLYSSNQVLITVTNGSPTNYYELLVQYELRDGSGGPWDEVIPGNIGVTNFYVTNAPQFMSFFRALACDDCDNDGVLNTQDANPFSTNVGLLTITIQSPANGANLQ